MADNGQFDLFAPQQIGSGAPVAQVAQKTFSEGDLRHCAIGGSATALTRKGAVSGAACHPSARGGATGRGNQANRIEAVKASLREASLRRSEVQPGADAHSAALKGARERLQSFHEQHRTFPGDAERKQCLAIHDDILAASIKWGRQAREYRELNSVIERMTKELSDLANGNEKR
jgi:hypothetical protein